MPDLSKAGTVEYEGDKEIRYDEQGNRHIRVKLDMGNYAADFNLPTVKSGPCLVTQSDGTVQACKQAIFAAPVEILAEREYFMEVRLRQDGRPVEMMIMFPAVAERNRISEQLRQVLGARG